MSTCVDVGTSGPFKHEQTWRKDPDILSSAVQEMQSSPDLNLNSWWGRVSHIKEKLGIKYSKFFKLYVIGHNLKKQIKGKFDTFWLDEIRKEKLGVDNVNHNKLRYYSSIKGCLKK